MASTLYFTSDGSNNGILAPVSPASPGAEWEHIATDSGGVNTWKLLQAADSSTLNTRIYTPDGADDTTSKDALNKVFISDALDAQTISGNITAQFQCLEANANNNLSLTLVIKVVSNDGGTVRATLLAITRDASEVNTALRNITFNSTALSSYTNIAGDRLQVEVGLGGSSTAGSGTNAHNGSIRFGGNASSGDLPVDETQTGTTYRPWIQFSNTIDFLPVWPTGVQRNVIARGRNANVSSVVIPSTTLVANRLYLLAITHIDEGAGTLDISSITSTGATWVKVDSVANSKRTSIWRTMVGSDQTGTITITPAVAVDSILYQLIEYINVDTSGTNGSGAIRQSKTATGTSTSPSVTLDSAILSGNATFGVVGSVGAITFTVGSGYIELDDDNNIGTGETATSIAVEDKAAGTTTVNGTLGSSVAWGIVGIEIQGRDVTSTLASNLAAAISSLTGEQVHTGTIASIMQAAVSALSGVMHPSGTIAGNLTAAVSALVGEQIHTGTIDSNLQAPISELAGSQIHTGIIASDMQAAISELAGSHSAGATSGIIDATQQATVSELLGVMHPTGILGASVQAAVSALAGSQEHIGTIASNLTAPISSFIGSHIYTGTVASVLQAITSVLSGGQEHTGSISSLLQAIISTFSGTQSHQGALVSTMTAATSSLTGGQTQSGSIASNLQQLLFSGAGSMQPSGIIGSTLTAIQSSLTGITAGPITGTMGATLTKLQASLNATVRGKIAELKHDIRSVINIITGAV